MMPVHGSLIQSRQAPKEQNKTQVAAWKVVAFVAFMLSVVAVLAYVVREKYFKPVGPTPLGLVSPSQSELKKAQLASKLIALGRQNLEYWRFQPDLFQQLAQTLDDVRTAFDLAPDSVQPLISAKLPLTTRLVAGQFVPGSIATVPVSVTDSSGAFVVGVNPGDLVVHNQKNERLYSFVLDEARTPIGDASLVLLLDASSSMQGKRIESLKLGMIRFVAGCGPTTRIKVMTFASHVAGLTDFTISREAVDNAIRSIAANGGTELVTGLEIATKSLSGQRGKKRIVLCTDGEDPKLATTLDTVTRSCNAQAVCIDVLAIDDPALDQKNLRRLAQSTGGEFLLASDAFGLNQRIESLLVKSSTRYYKLSIFDPHRAVKSVTVTANTAKAQADPLLQATRVSQTTK